MEKEPKDMTRDELRAFISEVMRQESRELFAKEEFIFKKDLRFEEGIKIKTGTKTGAIIGKTATDKIGFFGKVPVVQQATIADPSGGSTPGVDSSCRGAVNSIIDTLQALGFIS